MDKKVYYQWINNTDSNTIKLKVGYMECIYKFCDLNNGDGVCRSKLSPDKCGSRATFLDIPSVTNQVIDILVECFSLKKTPKPLDDIIKDVGLDSLEVMELVMNIEDRYNIHISDKEQKEIHTAEDIVMLISKNKNM